MFSAENRRRLGAAVGVIALLVISFHTVRYVAFSAQRSCIRAIVQDLSATLSVHGLDYWWDFGTLLGLIRERDIIYSEVDADISIPMSSRQRFYKQAGLIEDLEYLGYTIAERDENKLRLFGPWGWFGDMDVWTAGANASTLFMVTGKNFDRSRYVLPEALLLPTQPLSNLGISLSHRSGISDSIRVPAKPYEVLQYWYGPSWNVPRKYEKGNDPSGDKLEMFLIRNLMWVFELFTSLKALTRILLNGTFTFLTLKWSFANCFGVVVAIGLSWWLLRDPQRRTPVFVSLVLVLSLFVCAFTMATVLAVLG